MSLMCWAQSCEPFATRRCRSPLVRGESRWRMVRGRCVCTSVEMEGRSDKSYNIIKGSEFTVVMFLCFFGFSATAAFIRTKTTPLLRPALLRVFTVSLIRFLGSWWNVLRLRQPCHPNSQSSSHATLLFPLFPSSLTQAVGIVTTYRGFWLIQTAHSLSSFHASLTHRHDPYSLTIRKLYSDCILSRAHRCK
jgi:hypothetical protein